MLLTTLQERDPALLRKWKRDGELDLIVDEQVKQAISVLKWNLGDDPYNHPDPAQQEMAREFAIERLLEYPRM